LDTLLDGGFSLLEYPYYQLPMYSAIRKGRRKEDDYYYGWLLVGTPLAACNAHTHSLQWDLTFPYDATGK